MQLPVYSTNAFARSIPPTHQLSKEGNYKRLAALVAKFRPTWLTVLVFEGILQFVFVLATNFARVSTTF